MASLRASLSAVASAAARGRVTDCCSHYSATIRRLIATLPAFLLALALVSVATAATLAPTAAERHAIIHAFGDPPAASACLIVRLAASNHDYADVRFRMTSACQRWAFNGTNVLRRTRADRWSVVFEGSSYKCPRPGIPTGVQRDLGVCPA